ncbi:hypothetical protein L195_g029382, partial [Trifolium pratense]
VSQTLRSDASTKACGGLPASTVMESPWIIFEAFCQFTPRRCRLALRATLGSASLRPGVYSLHPGAMGQPSV